MPRKSARRIAIERRIFDAVRRAKRLGYVPDRLYLNMKDFSDLTDTWPTQPELIEIGGVAVRRGKASRLYCQRGVSTSV